MVLCSLLNHLHQGGFIFLGTVVYAVMDALLEYANENPRNISLFPPYFVATNRPSRDGDVT